MPTPLNSRVNKAILEQVKVEVGLPGLSFSSKFIWSHLYLVIILSFICSHVRKYFLQLEHRISSSAKPSISGATLSENVPWVSGINL